MLRAVIACLVVSAVPFQTSFAQEVRPVIARKDIVSFRCQPAGGDNEFGVIGFEVTAKLGEQLPPETARVLFVDYVLWETPAGKWETAFSFTYVSANPGERYALPTKARRERARAVRSKKLRILGSLIVSRDPKKQTTHLTEGLRQLKLQVSPNGDGDSNSVGTIRTEPISLLIRLQDRKTACELR